MLFKREICCDLQNPYILSFKQIQSPKFILNNGSKNIPARAKDPCTLPPGSPTVNSMSLFSKAETTSSSVTGTPLAYKLISSDFKDSNAAI